MMMICMRKQHTGTCQFRYLSINSFSIELQRQISKNILYTDYDYDCGSLNYERPQCELKFTYQC